MPFLPSRAGVAPARADGNSSGWLSATRIMVVVITPGTETVRKREFITVAAERTVDA
jgi:hypothetical protein